MAKLSKEARNLLQYIVSRISDIDVANPATYPTYSQAHEALGLSQIGADVGKSLQVQGLTELAQFAIEENLPAVTGFIVRKREQDPGKGFYTLYRKDEFVDSGWWLEETALAARSIGRNI